MPRHPSSLHYPYLCNVAYRYLIPNAFNSFTYERNLFTTGNADSRGLNTSTSYDRQSRITVFLLFMLWFCQLVPCNEEARNFLIFVVIFQVDRMRD
jgi:hypothetical protein